MSVPPQAHRAVASPALARLRATASGEGGTFSNPSHVVRMRFQSSIDLTTNPSAPQLLQRARYLVLSQLTTPMLPLEAAD